MIILYWIITPLIYGISSLPFFILHRISEFLFFLTYIVFRYRRRVVHENLVKSFPEKSAKEIASIERKYYLHFCDLLIEVIKMFTISEKTLLKRCVLTTPDLVKKLFDDRLNVTGISSHLCNWEWLAQCLSIQLEHASFAVYKPLSDQRLSRMVVRSRERFGIKMVPIKQLREVFKMNHTTPIMIGLLADQAPHDYSRAFEVQFLNQKTHVVPGPGIITVQRDFVPVWGWMRSTGRSRYEWGVEILDPKIPDGGWSNDQVNQIIRIAEQNNLSDDQSAHALAITIEFNKKLEEKIKMAPQDWLWSHRRWKSR